MYDLLDEFITYIAEKEHKSKNTCLSYRRDIRQLFDELSSSKGISRIEEITAADLQMYCDKMRESGRSAATISRLIASVKSFFTYLCQRKEIAFDPSAGIQPPKVIRKAPAVASSFDVERLLDAPQTGTIKGIRDRAMLALMSDTGLKVTELISLNLSDVDTKKKVANIGNGRTFRSAPFSKKTARDLNKYLRTARGQLCHDQKVDSLFVNCYGEPMTRQGFWKLIKQYGHDAGITCELTPHVLRHTFAVHALQSGVDARTVQSLLGNGSSATFSVYCSSLQEKKSC